MAHPRHRPDGLLTRRTARRLTRPYALVLSDAVAQAWGTWTLLGQLAPEVRMQIRPLGRAVDLWEFMTSEASRRFEKIKGCEIDRESNQTVLTFGGGDLRVTFNKIDPKRIPKPRTARQLKIFYQEDARVPVIPGMPRVTWAKCGYLLDRTETQIQRIVLACYQDGDTAWAIDLPTRAVRPAIQRASSVVPLATSVVPGPRITSATPKAAPGGQTGTT